MSNSEIRREDCPEGQAPKYPGKKNKNNKNGSDLSKSEFVKKMIEDWVRHFEGNEKYQHTPWANKTRYLFTHLEHLNVSKRDAQKQLIEIETKVAEEVEENEIIQSQNSLSQEMDVEKDESDKQESVRSRWGKDQEIKKLMELDDQQLFEGGQEIPENVKSSNRYKQREKMHYLSLSDNDLFERYDEIPPYTKISTEFKSRYTKFVEKYMDENFAQSSSQEILLKLPVTPAYVQNSEAYKDRLCHLSFAEKSQRLVMQNIQDTLNELEKTKEGRKQAKIIIAGVSHASFGDPGLNVSRTTKENTKKAKEDLLTGKSTVLKMPENKKRQVFPETVEAISINHWMENTIPEPAKHTGKALEEGGETVTTRYQDKTDKECFINFKEECEGKIKVEMKKVADEMIRNLSKRPDTADKRRRLEFAESLPDKFPSLDWYIQQRPKETKPLCNHTTGLCHLCEAAKQNFAYIVNIVKKRCRCGSHDCPNFSCVCPVGEEEDDETPCSCPPCECETCSSCQVGNFDFI